jgi:trimethylguanosine synthase
MKVNNFLILGWWSVTPEELAAYIANLCVDKVVVDGFCGSGGNVIQVIIC